MNFRRYLLKVTFSYEVLFSAETEAIQTEGCSMEGPLSETLANIHMICRESDVVKPLKPVFCK